MGSIPLYSVEDVIQSPLREGSSIFLYRGVRWSVLWSFASLSSDIRASPSSPQNGEPIYRLSLILLSRRWPTLRASTLPSCSDFTAFWYCSSIGLSSFLCRSGLVTKLSAQVRAFWRCNSWRKFARVRAVSSGWNLSVHTKPFGTVRGCQHIYRQRRSLNTYLIGT